MSYSGTFFPTNTSKYEGDPTQIYYRSSWELSVMLWCDTNPSVISWSSETVVVPYLCPTDKKVHRYFIDFKIKKSNGHVYLIEVKPRSQAKPPKPKQRKTKKYLNEVMTYAKNKAKWKAANEFALDRGWTFKVWTEDSLKELGIPILGKTHK